MYATVSNNKEFLPDLNKIFESLKISNLNNYYILAGDLNAKHASWGNTVPNARGRALNNWIFDKSFEYRIKLLKPDHPTFPRTNSFLDIMLVDARLYLNNENFDSLFTLEFDSDHWAISAEFLLPSNNYICRSKTQRPIYLFKKTNWSKFREIMESKITSNFPNNINLSNDQIEVGLKELDQVILETIKKTVPVLKRQNSMEKYMSKKIKPLHDIKNKILSKIRKAYRKYVNPFSPKLMKLKKHLADCKSKLEKEYSLVTNKHWADKMKTMSTSNPKQLFTNIKRLIKNDESLSPDNT